MLFSLLNQYYKEVCENDYEKFMFEYYSLLLFQIQENRVDIINRHYLYSLLPLPLPLLPVL
jgi:hypothetical protein